MDRSAGKLDEATVTHASEKVGFVYKLMLSLLSYHHGYGPVTIAREQLQSLEALLLVRDRLDTVNMRTTELVNQGDMIIAD